MAILSNIKINVDRCNKGIYLRWYHSQGGWHYQLVQTKIEGELQSINKDVKTDVDFSLLSKVQSLTGKDFAVTNYTFIYNYFPTEELDRLRALDFTDESKLLPQNP